MTKLEAELGEFLVLEQWWIGTYFGLALAFRKIWATL